MTNTAITPDDLHNYAEVLAWALEGSRGRRQRHGELVVVRYDHLAKPLVEALFARLTDAHLNVALRPLPTPLMQGERCLNSSFGQLAYPVPGEAELYAAAAALLTIYAPEDLLHLAHVDPRILSEAEKAEQGAGGADGPRAVLDRRLRAGACGAVSCLWPTPALAAAAGLEASEYEHEFLRACWLNMPDPVAEWRRLARESAAVCARLDGLNAQLFRVESEDLDLEIFPGDNRRFLGVTGRNLPGCEVYLAPDARRTRGVYVSDQPSIVQGRVVQGVRLEFHDGVAVRASAERGDGFLQWRLRLDAGARRVGEFSLTDARFSRVGRFMAHVLLDENRAGNCHLALGSAVTASFSGPPEVLGPELAADLGFNASSIHWDLVNTGPKTVTAHLPGGGRTVVFEGDRFVL
ncbi:MAG: aminopeptidase [Desulfovibrionaceae bacterium]